jgi:hypothetical protein
MSKPHLDALEQALARKGWRVVAVHPGNDYSVSGTWEIQRSTSDPSLFIDFDGLDDLECLPLDQSHGCQLRGHHLVSLYFRPINKSRQLWEQDLAGFVRSLDTEAGG